MGNSTSKYKILWLDDEFFFLSMFVEAIREDPEMSLELVSNVDDALSFLEKPNTEKPDLLIWDMILPTGSLSEVETEKGLRTGQVYFERFREIYPEVPAVLFTNVMVKNRIEQFNNPSQLTWVWRKRDLLPDEFLMIIKNIIQRKQPSFEERGVS